MIHEGFVDLSIASRDSLDNTVALLDEDRMSTHRSLKEANPDRPNQLSCDWAPRLSLNQPRKHRDSTLVLR